jgi:DNA-binding transcriptional ArsR family regulator
MFRIMPARALEDAVQPPGDAALAVPRRNLRDPRVLRALAHPLRLTLLETLADLGQATATELSERVGESPANCSWHLRQLARHGFIEEAGGGTGRQRPWRWIRQSVSVADADAADEPGLRHARDALLDVVFSRELDAWQAWRATAPPKSWSDASFAERSFTWLTAAELAEFKRDFEAFLEGSVLAQLGRADPARRPVGARPVRVVAWGFPMLPADESEVHE